MYFVALNQNNLLNEGFLSNPKVLNAKMDDICNFRLTVPNKVLHHLSHNCLVLRSMTSVFVTQV